MFGNEKVRVQGLKGELIHVIIVSCQIKFFRKAPVVLTQIVSENDTKIPERFQKNSRRIDIESIFFICYNNIVKNRKQTSNLCCDWVLATYELEEL